MLIAWMELPAGNINTLGGRRGVQGDGPPHLAGTAWSCPRIRVTCAIPNPPNKCDSSWQCPRHQKCCQGACGRRCLSRPPGIPTFHGTVLSEPPAVAVALGREVATVFRAGGGPGALSHVQPAGVCCRDRVAPHK
uniref:WAP domain-containing protein n=1 Tax=Anas zonorhyncha TaxID=75864 RepID=A0A8B9USA5_9AVES